MGHDYGLGQIGIKPEKTVYRNLSVPALVEEALRRGEGRLADNGALVVRTPDRSGRSPNDKFIVREPASEKNIWWGKVNVAISPEAFDKLYAKVAAHLGSRELFLFDGFVGADARFATASAS